MGIAAADDLVAAVDITVPFAAGKFGTLIGSPVLGASAADGDTALEYAVINAASWLHLTADSELSITIAGGDPLFVGKINVFVEYVV
jgi:hypothetical protein